MSVPEFSTQLAEMIGIGVGIDYALFIVARYRQGIHDGLDPAQRGRQGDRRPSGKAVFFAGCTVIISLAGMYLIGIEFVSGLATGAILAVAMTIATSLTLLPAVLGFVGNNIDQLHVPFVSRSDHHRDGFWYRWSRQIQRQPLPAAAARARDPARAGVAGVRHPTRQLRRQQPADDATPPAGPTTCWPRASVPGSTVRSCSPSRCRRAPDDAVLTQIHDGVAQTPRRGVRRPARSSTRSTTPR